MSGLQQELKLNSVCVVIDKGASQQALDGETHPRPRRTKPPRRRATHPRPRALIAEQVADFEQGDVGLTDKVQAARDFYPGHRGAVGTLEAAGRSPMRVKSGVHGGPWGAPSVAAFHAA